MGSQIGIEGHAVTVVVLIRDGGVAGGVEDKGENCRRFEIFY